MSLPARNTTKWSSLHISAAASRIVLPNRRSSLMLLSDWLQEFALANKLSDRCAFRLELVLIETVTNIVEHGGVGDDECSAIEVQVARDLTRIVTQVEDDGPPFDPTGAPLHRQPASLDEAPIGGLGLHLIRSYTEVWEYQRINHRNLQRMTIVCDSGQGAREQQA
jgi:serine/threonine-protein kinase RsbW